MKIFKLMTIALVAMLGFTACDKETEHIYDDHSADLVGTWTCLTENYAEALIINADGTAVSYGVENGEYWENVKGTVTVKENNITMIFEDNDNWTGHFDVIPGMAFSLYTDEGERYVYQYGANDLADEIVGMWVCHEGLPGVENDMAIFTYSEDGKMTMTTQASAFIPLDFVNIVCDYKVVGDLVFKNTPNDNAAENSALCQPVRMVYTPNGTNLGDIMTENIYAPSENGVVEITSSWLRIKQNLELPGKSYDYNNIYVTNVKGLDKDIEFMGYTVNFAKMDGSMLDKMLKNILFNISFPDANTINYTYHYTNGKQTFDAPIVVEGNKLTVKVSEKEATLKDVVFYVFQDADNSQLHIYMHKTAFVNFYTNMQAQLLEATDEQFDIKNEEAVNAIYNSINEAVETINLSLLMKARK